MRNGSHIILFAAAVVAAASCSVSRGLEEGQYHLMSNKVVIKGDNTVSPSEIARYIKQQPSAWWKFTEKAVTYNPDLVDASVESISNHLQYIGYYGSEVKEDVTVDGRKVKVTYTVSPGKRYIIDSIRYVTPSSSPEFARAFIQDIPNISIKKGSFLSESDLENESHRSATVLKGKGFYTITRNHYTFVADTLQTPGHAILEMIVNDYMRSETEAQAAPLIPFHIGNVTISHPASFRFRSDILRDITTIKPGGMYNDTDINNTFSRLSSLNTFSGVSINTVQTDESTVDCNISITPSKPQGYKANLEMSSNSTGLIGISPQLSFYNKNLFHGGEWLNVSLMGNFQFRMSDKTRANEFGISASLSLPKLLWIPYSKFSGPSVPRSEFSASLNYQDRPEYARSLFSTALSLNWRLSNNTVIQLSLPQINLVRLYNITPEFSELLDHNPYIRYSYMNHFDSGIGAVVYKTAGSYYYRLSTDLSGNTISLFKNLLPMDIYGNRVLMGMPYSQYAKADIELGRTFYFGKDDSQSIATRLFTGLGHAYGNSSAMPFEKQFYCGGANSMRGWQARTLGPADLWPSGVFTIPSQTGDIKLEADIEYRFPIRGIFEGALFAEAGNIWNSFEKFYETVAVDSGWGLRMNLQALIVRVDFGFKLRDPKRDGVKWLSPSDWVSSDGYAFHFGVGYPF